MSAKRAGGEADCDESVCRGLGNAACRGGRGGECCRPTLLLPQEVVGAIGATIAVGVCDRIDAERLFPHAQVGGVDVAVSVEVGRVGEEGTR